MFRYIFIPLVVVCFTATAGIYKWMDDDGKIHYSDQETEGAEQIKLSEEITYTPSKPKTVATKKAKPQQKFSYTSMSIVKPEMNEIIHDNSGNVEVGISLLPNLRTMHSITLYLDGKEMLKGKRQTTFDLQNIDRGSHTMRASVLDKNNVALISSKSVIFHLRRDTIKEKEAPTKDSGNAFKPDYNPDESKGADYEKDYKQDYDSSGSYKDGAKKYNDGIPSNSGNFKAGDSTYSPNYNQK